MNEELEEKIYWLLATYSKEQDLIQVIPNYDFRFLAQDLVRLMRRKKRNEINSGGMVS
jgi:hypothetical protein